MKEPCYKIFKHFHKEKEEFRELSQAEAKFKQLAASYLYLYHKAQEEWSLGRGYTR